MTQDGLLRLSASQLKKLRLEHLLSGIHEPASAQSLAACGRVTTITGFTEWVSAPPGAATLGWDWELRCACDTVHWRRLGLPYSNLMLVDRARRDLRWQQNLKSLARFIDALPWAESMLAAVAARYPWQWRTGRAYQFW